MFNSNPDLESISNRGIKKNAEVREKIMEKNLPNASDIVNEIESKCVRVSDEQFVCKMKINKETN